MSGYAAAMKYVPVPPIVGRAYCPDDGLDGEDYYRDSSFGIGRASSLKVA